VPDNCAFCAGAPVTEIAKKIAEKWKELDDKDKEPYNEMARKDKVRFCNLLAAHASCNQSKCMQPCCGHAWFS
jgi:HMG (high mobility group) box